MNAVLRLLCVLCIFVAVFWSCFSPASQFNFEVNLETTATTASRVNPLDFINTFAGTISTDANNAISGFSSVGGDNIFERVSSFFSALGAFFKNGFLLLVDVWLAPVIFVVDLAVTTYNLIAIWFGFPRLSVWIDPISRNPAAPVSADGIVGGGRGGR